MKIAPLCLIALSLVLASCGKKESEQEEVLVPAAEPQSAPGQMLDVVRKTVDAANERSESAKQAVDAATGE